MESTRVAACIVINQPTVHNLDYRAIAFDRRFQKPPYGGAARTGNRGMGKGRGINSDITTSVFVSCPIDRLGSVRFPRDTGQ